MVPVQMKPSSLGRYLAQFALLLGVAGLGAWWTWKGQGRNPGIRAAHAKAELIVASGAPETPAPFAASLPPPTPPSPASAARLLAFPEGRRFSTARVPARDRWPQAETLALGEGPVFGEIRTRVRIVKADFKHPLLRLEEAYRVDAGTGAETLLAQEAMVADHLILEPAPGVTADDLAPLLPPLGGTLRSVRPASGLILVTVSSPLDPAALPAATEAWAALHEIVSVAEPDFVVHALGTPSDPAYPQLWGLHNIGQTGGLPDADIDAPEAWAISTGSRSIVVGVIDTGIDYTHPDLAANIWTNPGEIPGNFIDDDGNGYVDDVHGWDFYNNDKDPRDDNGHGTHCAGIIGGVGNNGTGGVGVNWSVSMAALKFLSAPGSGLTSDAIEAISYATAKGMHLTSNSWGGNANSQSLSNAIALNGRLFLAAAGNDGDNNDWVPTYPASFPLDHIVSVAASNHHDHLAYFSNFGPNSVDLAAPGVAILSTIPGGDQGMMSGTSMAAPHVAGTAALLLAEASGPLSPQQLKNFLLSTVDPLPSHAGWTATGGRLNAANALRALDALIVAPNHAFSPAGQTGGPFAPGSATWLLSNFSRNPISWTASASQPWLQLSATSGSLAPGASVTLEVSLTAAADTLPAGDHAATITLSNVSTGKGSTTRSVLLRISPPSPPTITSPPSDLAVRPMENAVLRVSASGFGGLTYQWYRGALGDTSAPVPGATGALFISPPLTQTSSFWVRVANPVGATDRAATVTVAPEPDLNLRGMGMNYAGQLGDGSTVDRLLASHLLADVALVSASRQTAFVRPDGGLWTCGENTYGQLGDGSTTNRSSPVQIAGGVAQVAMGFFHGAFVKQDGTLWTMGRNSSGQLGDGTTTNRSHPIQVATDVVQAAAGFDHTLFLKRDGTLWAVGGNGDGQLGDGSTTQRLTPVQIATGVAAVRCGGYSHALFLKTDGTLWTMGRNWYGQLGDGSTISRSTPIQLASDVVDFALGERNNYFLRSNGTVWGAGNNSYGQLGSTLGNIFSTPREFATNVRRIFAGDLHAFLLRGEGDLFALGYNVSGQLGDGSTANRSSPVLVDTAVVSVAGASRFSLYLSRKPGIATQPADALISSGQTATLAVAAVGPGPLSYQWYRGASGDTSIPLTGANSSTFTTPALTSTTAYWARVSNAHGSVDSRGATVTVSLPPQVITQPLSSSQRLLRNTALSASASGSGLSYQWYRGESGDTSEPVAGATGPLFLVSGLQASTRFWVRISNPSGTVDSESATIDVPTLERLMLIASGSNTAGQLGLGTTSSTTTPLPVSDEVIQASGAYGHSLFVKADGTLWGAGSNAGGELGDGTTTHRASPIQIATDVVQASAGNNYSLFLKAGGTLWAMGENTDGQLGDGASTRRLSPVQVASGVAQVSAGHRHSLFIKTDGSLWAMGQNLYGQLGDGTTTQRLAPVQVATGVVQAAAGSDHSVFLKLDGTAWSMGYNSFGQLGDGSLYSRFSPVQIASEVVSIAAGIRTTFLVKIDGSLWAAGENTSNKLGDGSFTQRSTPVLILGGVDRVSTGYNHNLALKNDGSVWAWGSNAAGSFGNGTTTNRSTPGEVASEVGDIAAGNFFSLFLSQRPAFLAQPVSVSILHGQGTTLHALAGGSPPITYQWYLGAAGDTSAPLAGATQASFETGPLSQTRSFWVRATNARGYTRDSAVATVTVVVVDPPQISAQPAHVTVLAGDSASFAVSASGGNLAYQWYRGAPGDTTAPIPGAIGAVLLTPPLRDATSVWVRISNSVGAVNSSAATATLRPRDAWNLKGSGQNDYGQLGDGSTTQRNIPVLVASDVVSASTSVSHSLFIKADASLWAMGANNLGQLGDGSTTQRLSPVQVATGVLAASASGEFSLFLKTDGTFWASGANHYGRFGLPGVSQTSTPVQIAGDVVHFAAGRTHSLFVKTDGSLWAMGDNSQGQLGDGSTVRRTTPVQIAGGVARVAAGLDTSFFIKTDGSLWAMGENFWGQLGNGLNVDVTTPQKIADDVVLVAAGSEHTLMLKRDGTLLGMGYNGAGALGLPTGSLYRSPTLIATNVARISGGFDHSKFVQTDGSLWAMGINLAGQHGDGTTTTRYAPVQVAAAAGDCALAYYHGLFLHSPPPRITAQPLSRTIATGASATITVGAASPVPLSYQWFRGERGDLGQPIAGASSPSYLTPTLQETSRFWVRVTNPVGSADSDTVMISVSADLDSDGLPNAWELLHGLDPESSEGVNGRLGDPDGDQLPNLLEYAFGLNPRASDANPVSVTTIPADSDVPATHLVVAYRRLMNPGSISYLVQTSTDLVSWAAPVPAPEILSVIPNGDGLTETVVLRLDPALGGTPLFVRLQVSAP